MNRSAIAVVGIACLLPLVPLPARADAPNAVGGYTCGLTASNDPTGAAANPSTAVGEVTAGPISAADMPDPTDPSSWDITGNPASVTITCSVQVGGFGHPTDADAVSASASGTPTAYLPPTLVSFTTSATDPVYLCTALTLTDAHGDSETLYYDDLNGDLVTDPFAANCPLAISSSGGPIIDIELWIVTPILVIHLHIVIDHDPVRRDD